MVKLIITLLALCWSVSAQSFTFQDQGFVGKLASVVASTPTWYDTTATDDGSSYFSVGLTYWDSLTVNQTGNATSLRIYIGANHVGGKIRMGLYRSSDKVLLSGTLEGSTSTAGWVNIALSNSVPVTSGTVYIIGFNSDDSNAAYRRLTSSNSQHYYGETYSAFPTTPITTGSVLTRIGRTGVYVE